MTLAPSSQADRAMGGKQAPLTALMWQGMNQGAQTAAAGDRARDRMGDKATQYIGPEHIQKKRPVSQDHLWCSSGHNGGPRPIHGGEGGPSELFRALLMH